MAYHLDENEIMKVLMASDDEGSEEEISVVDLREDVQIEMCIEEEEREENESELKAEDSEGEGHLAHTPTPTNYASTLTHSLFLPLALPHHRKVPSHQQPLPPHCLLTHLVLQEDINVPGNWRRESLHASPSQDRK